MKAFVAAFVLWSILPNLVMARVWTDRTGKHQVEAEFVDLTDGNVKLKQSNGWLLTVPLETLSVADRVFASQQAGQQAIDAASARISVELVGLTISKPYPEAAPGMIPMHHWTTGTSLRIRLADPNHTLLGYDEHASKLTELTDDQGTDLTKVEDGPGPGIPAFGPLRFEIAPEQHVAMLDISAGGIPAVSAKALKCSAQLVVLAGFELKTVEQKELKLTPGTEITTGPIPMSIGQEKDDGTGDVGQGIVQGFSQALGGFGNNQFTAKRRIRITSAGPMMAIQQLKFFTLTGDPIEHQQGFRMSTGLGAKARHVCEYLLADDVERVNLKVTYYDKVVAIHVPIEITTGVGLQPCE